MANNFSDAIHYYLFESGSETTDGAGNSNLTAGNTPGYETSSPIEGGKSADLDVGSTEYFSVDDGNLPATNPLKSSSSEDEFSVSILVMPYLDTATVRTIFSKYDSGINARTLLIRQSGTSTVAYIGYSSGVNIETLYTGSSGEIPKNKKLHIGFTYKYSTKAWTLRVYNVTDSAETLNTSGTSTNTMSRDTAKLGIGSYFSSGNPGSLSWDGLIDEVVIWNSIKTVTDWGNVIAGTYGGGGTPSTLLPINVIKKLYAQQDGDL